MLVIYVSQELQKYVMRTMSCKLLRIYTGAQIYCLYNLICFVFTDEQPVNPDLDHDMDSTMPAHATGRCSLSQAQINDANDGKCFCGLFLKFL